MTEAEWLASTDLSALLRHIGASCNARKARLFACACCRCVWDHLGSTSHPLIAQAEQWANAKGPEPNWMAARRAMEDVLAKTEELYPSRYRFMPEYEARLAVLRAMASAATPETMHSTATFATRALVLETTPTEASDPRTYMRTATSLPRFCPLLREIFGNPFRPVVVDPSWLRWRDGFVVAMARVIADEARFEDLPILADALEEAGCDNRDLLGHLRTPDEHVRGCWALDLLLNRA